VRGIAFTSLLVVGMVWPRLVEGQRATNTSFAAFAPQSAGGVDLRPTSLSLVLPGAGQHLLGQDRKWAYLALEIAGWAFFVERRRAGSDYRDRYRDFAWENGRVQGSLRIDGDFDYYERLAHWTRSGAFDRDAASAGIQPELDDATFNGSVWSLATRIYLGGATNVPESDPAYQSALAYYSAEAYATELLWDWTAAAGAQSDYADLLDTSDGRFRQATAVLGIIIANHILSAADAYISSRGRSGLSLRVLPDPARSTGWSAVLTMPYR
jgi:hypothetical protein